MKTLVVAIRSTYPPLDGALTLTFRRLCKVMSKSMTSFPSYSNQYPYHQRASLAKLLKSSKSVTYWRKSALAETIKAIIFDFGGVISHPQNKEVKYQMIDILKINHAEFTASYFKHRHPYDAGLLTGQQYWTRICTDHAIDIEASDILKLIELDVKGWTEINTEMLSYISLLQNSSIKTALLSNMTFDILDHIQATYQWINDFDTCVFSCEHMVTKPDKRLYEICIEALHVNPVNCLFIDDTKQNVIAAQELRIKAIQYVNVQDFNQKLLIHYYI